VRDRRRIEITAQIAHAIDPLPFDRIKIGRSKPGDEVRRSLAIRRARLALKVIEAAGVKLVDSR
jgi:hypothetical protein